MSWLSDHLFGAPKTNEQNNNENAPSEPDADQTAPPNQEPQNELQTMLADAELLYDKREVAAEWHVPLRGQLYKIEFEHGTTSGKRVLWIDKKVSFFFRKMFFLNNIHKNNIKFFV